MLNEILEFLKTNKNKNYKEVYSDVPIKEKWNENERINKFLSDNNIAYSYHNVNMKNILCPELKYDGRILLPPISYYKNIDNFYHNLFHEIIHKIGKDRQRLYEYELDEIIAEIGALILSKEFGLKIGLKNCYRYIHIWIDRYIKNISFSPILGNIDYKNILKLCYNEAIARTNFLRK